MPLPPINKLTFVVTGSTSGFGKKIARQLAEAGAHVVMAVRNPKAANDLIKKWQENWSGRGLPLNIEMHNLGFVDPEDMNVTSGKRKFSSMVGYASSKLAQGMTDDMVLVCFAMVICGGGKRRCFVK